MTTISTLPPAKAAFVDLSEHCVRCRDCRPNPKPGDTKPECQEAAKLYRAWFDLWREEVRS
ncbi:hypothetical protein OG252_12940 [Streptomyces sp. NBC_01352]|uniref:hypothetical protein n=1 Tax=Streptomyces sp. NBC_01352 TaxID=2903834 RepID=UPI002E30C957|nr:hypothetical protein [Streptomyces sp. NBC_01352]